MLSPNDGARIREVLRDAGARAGIVDTELASRFADPSWVVIGDDGETYGADVAIAALRDRVPTWFIDSPEKLGQMPLE